MGILRGTTGGRPRARGAGAALGARLETAAAPGGGRTDGVRSGSSNGRAAPRAQEGWKRLQRAARWENGEQRAAVRRSCKWELQSKAHRGPPTHAVRPALLPTQPRPSASGQRAGIPHQRQLTSLTAALLRGSEAAAAAGFGAAAAGAEAGGSARCGAELQRRRRASLHQRGSVQQQRRSSGRSSAAEAERLPAPRCLLPLLGAPRPRGSLPTRAALRARGSPFRWLEPAELSAQTLGTALRRAPCVPRDTSSSAPSSAPALPFVPPVPFPPPGLRPRWQHTDAAAPQRHRFRSHIWAQTRRQNHRRNPTDRGPAAQPAAVRSAACRLLAFPFCSLLPFIPAVQQRRRAASPPPRGRSPGPPSLPFAPRPAP